MLNKHSLLLTGLALGIAACANAPGPAANSDFSKAVVTDSGIDARGRGPVGGSGAAVPGTGNLKTTIVK